MWLAMLSMVAFCGAGFALQRTIGFRARGSEEIALAWLMGCGAIAWVLLVFETVGVSNHTVFPWLFAASILWAGGELALRGMQAWQQRCRPSSWTLFEIGLLVAALSAALYLATSSPMLHFDERFTWAFKAKVIYFEGGVYNAAFLDPDRFHVWRQYPLLVPYTEAFVAWSLSHFDEAIIKFVFPCFFFALVILFATALRARIDRGTALLTTAYLVCLPGFLIRERWEGGSYLSGFADLPLAAYVFATFALLERYRRDREIPVLLASAICLGFALVTKRDGLVFLAACSAAVIASALRRELPIAHLARGAIALVAISAPFVYFKSLLPEDIAQPDRDYIGLLDLGLMSRNLFDAEIAGRYLGTLAGPTWGFVGLFVIGACAFCVWRERFAWASREFPLLAFVVTPFVVYWVAFSVTPFDATSHMDVALLRLQSQFVPLWTFASAVLLMERRSAEQA